MDKKEWNSTWYWSPSQSNQVRNINKRHRIRKEEVKLPLFADYMIYM